jgi:hypothetical protein
MNRFLEFPFLFDGLGRRASSFTRYYLTSPTLAETGPSKAEKSQLINTETTNVYCPYLNQTVEIDTLMLPLMKHLWRLDICTIDCCQEYEPGLAAIGFSTTCDTETFLTMCEHSYRLTTDTWHEESHGERRDYVVLMVLFPMTDIYKIIRKLETW